MWLIKDLPWLFLVSTRRRNGVFTKSPRHTGPRNDGSAGLQHDEIYTAGTGMFARSHPRGQAHMDTEIRAYFTFLHLTPVWLDTRPDLEIGRAHV